MPIRPFVAASTGLVLSALPADAGETRDITSSAVIGCKTQKTRARIEELKEQYQAE